MDISILTRRRYAWPIEAKAMHIRWDMLTLFSGIEALALFVAAATFLLAFIFAAAMLGLGAYHRSTFLLIVGSAAGAISSFLLAIHLLAARSAPAMTAGAVLIGGASALAVAFKRRLSH